MNIHRSNHLLVRSSPCGGDVWRAEYIDHLYHICVQTVMVNGHAESALGLCRRAHISDRRDSATTPPLDERENSLPYIARPKYRNYEMFVHD
ncbi:uncharacterized protein ARMOST_17936 [Armillaria ostoyae]|uniref:Uncharacterized protein n=1 Tax=Armillaria ostoyae TaxID=47428 RepID=A0A284S0H3_ARMOS|nr:uncharacterized protein ARMOST_17936 [Armillaria ostoyae]